ncbi:hypothetical protein HJ588_05270 [Flexivirga sp. ID2601S]|uniref:Uncharacterized protein n=1 Tax=Flexivirga aerilata TaxID=1656889 RepID=A0A849ADW8_9MICO|nr:hypothetical protein [Flexivirga aerilata]NNG38685.1 hypothetical protein [Flexivirga aerilata]
MSPHDDLERRLRDAFEAKASQITPDSLDRDRELEFEQHLRVTPLRRGPRRGVLAGAGLLAAAAAAAGVLAITFHPGDNGRVVDAARTVTQSTGTTSPSAPSGSPTSAPPATATSNPLPVGPQRPTGQATRTTAPQPSQTAQSTAPSAAPSSEQPSSAAETVNPSAAAPSPNLSIQRAPRTSAPPLMSSGLPQAAGLTTTDTYYGPIPLFATLPDGSGATYNIPMPDGAEWQLVANAGPRYRVLASAGSVADYWAQTLPGQGWVQSGAGWTFPGTPYTVSLSGDLVFAGYGG